MNGETMKAVGRAWIVMSLLAVCDPALAAEPSQPDLRLEIDSQPIGAALNEFARQSGLQVFLSSEDGAGIISPRISGTFTAETALDRLLANSGLKYEYISPRTIAVRAAKPGEGAPAKKTSGTNGVNGGIRLAQAEEVAPAASRESRASEKSSKLEEVRVHLPEVLVTGSNVLNMDIKRSRDDAQPYVIFEREAIERSGVTNVEDFLKQRLPMNAQGQTFSQSGNINGNSSQINLRGLGSGQTLILIDGHRAVGVNSFGSPNQPDLNGIPMAAVERIEVLPTTASGIYGGSATGGVVNVILRRDYAGLELKATYDNTFGTDSAGRRLDFAAGFALEGGRTQVLVAANYADKNFLTLQDTDALQRGRSAMLANNPGALLNSATPPLGAGTNIRSTNGSNLVLRDGTPLNSPRTYIPVGYAGVDSDGGAALVANAGQYNLDLANSAQLGGGAKSGLLNAPLSRSFMTTVRREFTDNIRAFLDLSSSDTVGYFPHSLFAGFYSLAPNAPGNPFNQAIAVRVPTSSADGVLRSAREDLRAAGGLVFALPFKWSAGVDYTWDRSRYEYSTATSLDGTEAAAMASGALDVFRDTDQYPPDFSPYFVSGQSSSPLETVLKDATLRIAGPIASWPTGSPTVSVQLERLELDLAAGYQFVTPTSTSFFPSRSQTVNSAYVETKLPLISPAQQIRFAQMLELQIAARWDEYTVNGAASVTAGSTTSVVREKNRTRSTNPTLGLRFQPSSDVMLRASYGTGFLPPAVNQIVAGAPGNFAAGVIDVRRGNEPTGAIQLVQGGNSGLDPEESESWSAGAVLTPHVLPGLRLSIDYTRIDKTGNIFALQPQAIVDNERLLSDRVVRGAAAPGDPFGVGPIVRIDRTLMNISRAQIEAFDLAFDYGRDFGALGRFDFFAVATRQLRYRTQLAPAADDVENVGISTSFPVKLKANAGLNWSKRNWTAGWNTRYVDSYLAADPSATSSVATLLSQGSDGRVASQAYHDLFAGYRFEGHTGLASGLGIQGGIRNVFDKTPPFDAANTLSLYSYLGDPTPTSYYLSLKVTF